MKKWHWTGTWFARALLVTALGCRALGQDPPLKELALLEGTSAQGVVPGSIITVPVQRKLEPNASPPQILISNAVVPIQKVNVSSSSVSVLVPNLPAGRATVWVRWPGDVKLTPLGDIVVAPAPSKQLVLSLRDDKITLIQNNPRPGEIVARSEADTPRISYDVFDKANVFVTNGWVIHPVAGRKEVFDEPGRSKRGTSAVTNRTETFFFIKIPNIPGGGRVRFYEAPASVDLTTEKGRARRRFLNEVTFE